MRKNTPPWYALSGWKKNKRKAINTFQLFWSFSSNGREPPKTMNISVNFFLSPVHSPYWGCWTFPLESKATAESAMATTAVAQCGYWVLPFSRRLKEGAVFDRWSYKTAGPSAPNQLPPHSLGCKVLLELSSTALSGTQRSQQVFYILPPCNAIAALLYSGSSSIIKLQIYSPQEVVSLCRCKE